MPYSLIDDTLGRDPRWLALSGGDTSLRKNLLASYIEMLCESASHLNEGYLHRAQALACASPRIIDLLCTPVLGEKPFLHRPGQQCDVRNCLDDSGPWREGFDYRICGFLKRNPSRAENKRHRGQKADSRDARLKELVYERDGGCCRYCRSGPLKKRGMGRARDRRRVLQFDHPDPDQVATPPGQPEGSNYVVACARCNEFKGHRTPDEAGMVLLPEPTDEERKAWSERGEALFDLPADNDNDKQPDKRHNKQQTNSSSFVPSFVSSVDADADPARESRLDPPSEQQRQATVLSSEGSGSGRGGAIVDVPPAEQLPRSSDAPDPYTKRSRGSRGSR